MNEVPVMLKVRDRRCVIVGGGAVARRRAATLLTAGARLSIVAPQIDPELQKMGLTMRHRPYRQGDLDGAALVIVATDDPQVNATVARDARRAGILLNRVDNPDECDVIFPAHAHHGPVTIAVHTGGISPAASAAIRSQLSDTLDPDWPHLLEIVAPFRVQIQEQCADPRERREKLAALTNPHAMQVLKRGAEEALRLYCRNLCNPIDDRPT